MEPGRPSLTALGAAAHRAAHQVLEGGRIFADPLALRIFGETAETVAAKAEADPDSRRMRIFIALRSRFAEDSLAKAVAGGTRQVVILGAGLDTFAYRDPFGSVVRVFEVDHPDTQEWKRQRLAASGIAAPSNLTYAPVDFEQETLAEALPAAGFDPQAPAFFTWLGVIPYLTEASIFATLGEIAGFPGGAEIVFDYGEPPETLAPELRAALERRAARVAALGERWITFFEPASLAERLHALGFATIEDLSPADLIARYVPGAPFRAPSRGGHMVRAATR
ncbi:MAG TPA: SAM-dependent methyltransferase [Stellaceae bacterium]|nr:SAM-dependent methyltransferase [Stellaceae bacterium]